MREGGERLGGACYSLYSFYPAEEPGGGDVHDETIQSEGQEAEETGRGHFKYFPALKHRKDVKPFCGRPIIPELPQPAANPAGEKESVQAAAQTFGEIADKGWKTEAAIEGIEEQQKSHPDEREKKRGDVAGHEQRNEQAGRAGNHQHVFCGARALRRLRRQIRFGCRRLREHCLDEVGGLEHGRSDGGEGPGVTEKRGGPGAREAHVRPILQPEIIGLENQPERNREYREARDDNGCIVEARTIGEGEDSSIGDEDVGTPGDGGEISGDGLDAREQQCFGGEQSEPSEPAVSGEWAEASGAEISEEQGCDCGGGEREAESGVGVWHERVGRELRFMITQSGEVFGAVERRREIPTCGGQASPAGAGSLRKITQGRQDDEAKELALPKEKEPAGRRRYDCNCRSTGKIAYATGTRGVEEFSGWCARILVMLTFLFLRKHWRVTDFLAMRHE